MPVTRSPKIASVRVEGLEGCIDSNDTDRAIKNVPDDRRLAASVGRQSTRYRKPAVLVSHSLRSDRHHDGPSYPCSTIYTCEPSSWGWTTTNPSEPVNSIWIASPEVWPISSFLFALYRSPPLNLTWTLIVVGAVSEYVFVGPVEELAFRGYLQNKLVALLDTEYSRLDTALGIVGAAVTFSILHVPTEILLDGLSLSQIAGSLVLFVATGVTFRTIYAVTRNLYLVMFLHGIGNFWPLPVDPGLQAWPNWGIVLVLYALLALLYRRWAVGTSRLDPGVTPVSG